MTGMLAGDTVARVAAATMILTASAPAGAAQDTAFSAEVTVTHTMVDASGTVLRELPSARYRLEKRANGTLRLTMLATRSSPARGPLADRYAGVTVDATDDGSLRVRDAGGEIVASPAATAAPGAPADDEGLIVRVSDRGRRLGQLAQRYGRAAGTVRALSRYLVRRGRLVDEVLVAPALALPVEVNRLDDGVLVERHWFDYTPAGDDVLVRTRTRSESAAPGGTGARLVSVTTLSAVHVAAGAR